MSNIRWGIIGAGHIAGEAADVLYTAGIHFACIYNRTREKAEQLAEKYQIDNVCGTIEELLASDIDAVYIATLHNSHYQQIRMALDAGKHVLCEKSITLNSEELEELTRLAEEKNLILAEAMTIYHMPLYERITDMISSGKTGKVCMIDATYGSYNVIDPESRFFDLAKGGGASLDIGVYAITLARYFMSAQPEQICSLSKPAHTGTDEQFGIIMQNSHDELASIMTNMRVSLPVRAVVSCEHGYFEINGFTRADRATYTDGKTRQITEITVGERNRAMLYEFQNMEKAIEKKDPSIMKVNMTRDVMAIMTRVRRDWNYRFPEEN